MTITLRKMKELDYEMMTKWLSTPQVLEFYGDVEKPFTIEQIKEKYGPRVEGNHYVVPMIAEMDDAPIGYLQYYRLSPQDQQSYGYGGRTHVFGMDMFIGEPSLFGKGYGTEMVKKIVGFLLNVKQAQIIVLDPAVQNERAIKCYQKCGFVKVKKVKENEAWLMAYEK